MANMAHTLPSRIWNSDRTYPVPSKLKRYYKEKWTVLIAISSPFTSEEKYAVFNKVKTNKNL